MNKRVLALVGLGLFAAAVVVAEEPLEPVLATWPAPPYWLPVGALPVEETEAGEVREEAVEPVVVRALPLVAIPPCRLLDTRTVGLPLLSDVAQEVAVVGRCGIPAQAQGVSLRLMVAESVGRGEVSLGGAGEGARAGRLVLEVGEARSTTGVAALDQTGQLLVSAENGSAQVIVDANGYYAPEPAVRSLNALAGDVVLEAGENVEITTEGSVVTIALARGEGREGERPQESQPPPLGPRVPARRLVQVPPSQPTRTLPPVKAMAPPSSSLYVAGALGLPDTTALGAGALTLGGDRFLHNYGPASDAGNTFVGEGAGNFTMGGLESWEGKANTAIGSSSLSSNTTGFSNTAIGSSSLSSNATGDSNTASGSSSLLSNTMGYQNTASGVASLYSNSTGSANTASGLDSLYSNATGSGNTASGLASLLFNSTGDYNTASGYSAGDYNTTGSYNSFFGALSDASAKNLTNATAIGFGATVDASNHVRIGNTSVTEIGGQVAWSNLSDARHKENIRDLDLGLDFVLGLRPVAFRLKQGNGRTDMGFLAQDIEGLIGDGYNLLGIGQDVERTLSLRATDLIAPLARAVQEQQELIEGQRGLIETLQARLEQLERELEALHARPDRARPELPTGL